MNGIIRVFPERTKFTPDDCMVRIGHPRFAQIDGQVKFNDRWLPPHKEIHISCIFSWDRALGEKLLEYYREDTNKPVKLGGPAFGSPVDGFTQGMYIKSNIIFTTRGCNNQCPWCIVPKIEGRLRELPVVAGNVIQDNNFLQANRAHKDKVFDMLRTQKQICFKGGLEPDLIDDHFVDALQSLYYTWGTKKVSRIAELWLACDTDGALPTFKRACAKLTAAGFDRDKIYCYALIGDDMDKNEDRLLEIYHAGAMPRAQLYRPFGDTKKEYGVDWNKFQSQWTRPAATVSHVEKGTHYKDFHT